MPLIWSWSHHCGIYKLLQVRRVLRGSEIPRHSSLFHLIPLRQMFTPARWLIRLYDSDVLAEWSRWKSLGVVLVWESVVVVDVVETTLFDCLYVPRWSLEPTLPRITHLVTQYQRQLHTFVSFESSIIFDNIVPRDMLVFIICPIAIP